MSHTKLAEAAVELVRVEVTSREPSDERFWIMLMPVQTVLLGRIADALEKIAQQGEAK